MYIYKSIFTRSQPDPTDRTRARAILFSAPANMDVPANGDEHDAGRNSQVPPRRIHHSVSDLGVKLHGWARSGLALSSGEDGILFMNIPTWPGKTNGL